MPLPEKSSPLTPAERRARREERRLKQRAVNVGRAAKMHNSRLEWERSSEIRRARDDRAIGRNQIGCSGWYYWHWHARFYPVELPRVDWFRFYSEQFDTVELNAPFYSWPTVATVRGWLKQAEDRPFIYTVKVCELITHVKRFSGTKTLVRDFGHIADLLGPRMGCFLFQLPPSFRYTAARLRRIVEQLDPAHRNVVEFRHPSWWNKKVFGAFRERGIIFCSCSAPGLPDQLVKTADEIYVRFHGPKRWYRYDYSHDELAEWVRRIKASDAKRVWAYFNNDRDCYAIKNARELRRQLKTETLKS